MIRAGKFALGALALVAVAGIAWAAFVRVSDMPPEVWHADPETAEGTGRPNEFRIAPGGDREPILLDEAPVAVATRLRNVALADPRTELIAGSAEEGWMTFVQRTALMEYPDAISVKVAPDGAGSRLTLWSRSRFGQSDLGVNGERAARWLAAAGID